MNLKSRLRKMLSGASDPDNFGNVAIDLGYVTAEDVQAAIKKQKEELPLGEILILMEKMDEFQRDQVLVEQSRRRASSNAELAEAELHRQRIIIKQINRSLKDVTDATTDFVASVTPCRAIRDTAEVPVALMAVGRR